MIKNYGVRTMVKISGIISGIKMTTSSVIILILVSLSLLVFIGCQERVVCNSPYILKGTECCLDNNANSICDTDEQQLNAQPTITPIELEEVPDKGDEKYDLVNGPGLVELQYTPMQCLKTKWEGWSESQEDDYLKTLSEEELIKDYYAKTHDIEIKAIKRVDQDVEECRTDCTLCPKGYYFLIKVDQVHRGKLVELAWKRYDNAKIEEDEQDDFIFSLEALRSKVAKLESYEYYDRELGFVLQKGGNTLIVLPLTLNRERKYNYNHVLLDHQNKKATAFCKMDQFRSGKTKCTSSPANRYFEVDYEPYVPKDFFGHIEGVDDVKKLDSKTCEKSRQCDLYEYTKGNERHIMYVRQINGIPYKVVRMEPDGSEFVIEIYTDVSYNSAYDDAFEIPSNYKPYDQ